MPRVDRRAPGKTHTQSVLFDREHWTEERARAWLEEHDYITGGLDETEERLRFRQYDPDDRFRYRTQDIEREGVSLVQGFPKGSRPKGIVGRLLSGESVSVLAPKDSPLLRFRVKVEKLDEERRVAYGWASVIEEGGEEVVDYDREIITEDDLVSYVHKFKLGGYGGKVMHAGERVSELVESLVFTKDIQRALGIDLGKVGWWVGFQYEPKTWSRVKSGELPMFSLRGVAVPRRR